MSSAPVAVYARDAAGPVPAASPPPGVRVVVWRPAGAAWRPPGAAAAASIVWWLFHHLRVFANSGYAAVLVYEGDRLTHRSSVFPRYARFPFMAPEDLQVGATWTAPEARGRGHASLALAAACALVRPGGRMWYLAEATNLASTRVAERTGFRLVGRAVRTAPAGLRAAGRYEITGGPRPAAAGVDESLAPGSS